MQTSVPSRGLQLSQGKEVVKASMHYSRAMPGMKGLYSAQGKLGWGAGQERLSGKLIVLPQAETIQ